MADANDLKHMVMSFRVSELQVLLGFAGRNKSGRKQELMQRALQLVQKGCSTAIHIKIRELYRRFPPKSSSLCSSKAISPQQPSTSPTRSPPSRGYSTYSSSSSSYKSSSLANSSSSTSGSGAPLDFSSKLSLGSPTSTLSNQVPVHPDVRFKRLPFYDLLGELLKPSSLVPRNQTRFQETFFIFHLTPQQAQDIAMSRDTQLSGRVDYTVQIQLRFCLLETSCEQEDNFPPSICVRVNGKMAPLPNPIPTNKPGVEPKRPSRPVNITTICRISPTVPNHISISWASELGRSYCVAVYLVRRLTSNVLMQRLKQSGHKHPDHTRALIKEKLAQDPDSEIVTSSLRVSLLCPLGKMRMTVPARSSTCSHLQCFDAPTYLQMNEKKPTWNCPVCDKTAEFDKLFIDGLFSSILRKESDCREIKFTADGSWQPMREKHNSSCPDSPFIQSIEDSPNEKRSEKAASQKALDVIDLTETDDEEEGEAEIIPVAVSVPDSGSSVGSPSSPPLSHKPPDSPGPSDAPPSNNRRGSPFTAGSSRGMPDLPSLQSSDQIVYPLMALNPFHQPPSMPDLPRAPNSNSQNSDMDLYDLLNRRTGQITSELEQYLQTPQSAPEDSDRPRRRSSPSRDVTDGAGRRRRNGRSSDCDDVISLD